MTWLLLPWLLLQLSAEGAQGWERVGLVGFLATAVVGLVVAFVLGEKVPFGVVPAYRVAQEVAARERAEKRAVAAEQKLEQVLREDIRMAREREHTTQMLLQAATSRRDER